MIRPLSISSSIVKSRHHGSSLTVVHGSHVDHTCPRCRPVISSLETKYFLARRICPVTIQSHRNGVSLSIRSTICGLARCWAEVFDFWFSGAKPNKWLILNRIIDLSDLRRQQISRKWETKERIVLTSRTRHHCLRKTID